MTEALKLLTDGILKLLVGYLEFALDFLALQRLDPYVKANKIDPLLLSYFIIGAAVAYFLTKGHSLPGLSGRVEPENRQADDQMAFGAMIFKVFLGAAASHVVLLAGSYLGAAEIGTVRDSFNAWLAWSAVMFPVRVIALRINSAGFILLSTRSNSRLTLWAEAEPAPPLASGKKFATGVALVILSLSIDTVVYTYCGFALARVHSIRPIVGMSPLLLYLLLITSGFGAFWFYKKIAHFRRTWQRESMPDSLSDFWATGERDLSTAEMAVPKRLPKPKPEADT